MICFFFWFSQFSEEKRILDTGEFAAICRMVILYRWNSLKMFANVSHTWRLPRNVWTRENPPAFVFKYERLALIVTWGVKRELAKCYGSHMRVQLMVQYMAHMQKYTNMQNYDIHCILDVHHPLRKYENQQKAEKSQDKKCLNAHHCLHIELKIRNRSSA